MRKRLLESRTDKEAHMIGKQRILDGIAVYDKYVNKGEKENKSYFIQRCCPFCGESEYKEETKFQDRWGVARCIRCHSLYVNPCPAQDVLDDYYNNYPCNFMLEDIYAKRAAKKENAILDQRVETILKYVNRVPREEVYILDVGCSNGSFLSRIRTRTKELAVDKKLYLFGVDVNENAVNKCIDSELNLRCCSIEKYLDTKEADFDIIWHSELVEHLIDPYAVFLKLNSALNRGGVDDIYYAE